MNISEIISHDPVWLAPDDSLAVAVQTMKEGNCSFVPVLRDDHPVGVITDRDIAIALAIGHAYPEATRVRDIMITEPVAIHPFARPEDVAERMAVHNVRRLIVEDSGRLVGVVSVVDLAGRMADDRVAEILRTMAVRNQAHKVVIKRTPVHAEFLG